MTVRKGENVFHSQFARRPASREPRGQILVIVAAGFIVMVAFVGLVIDGGMAWGQQRDNQNAADAVSEAGALVLAERLAGQARTDADVLAAVDDSVAENNVVKVGAWYTDILGQLLDAGGGVVASTSAAAEVGGGGIPPNGAGVQADTEKTFDTFLMSVIGRPTLSTVADATAVAGYIEGVCPATADCAILPVTIPMNIIVCDGTNHMELWLDGSNQPQIWGYDSIPPYFNVPLTIPLCANGPGNVGWLDWHPPGGGTSELIDAIGPPGTLDYQITVPDWYFVSETGNVNSGGVEDALNWYAANNIPVLIPMFDGTCNAQPSNSTIGGCPPGNVGGNGVNQWYHLDRFVAFLFENPQGAYLQGNNTTECEVGGNGATSCLKGQFVRFVGPNATVGPAPGTAGAFSAVGIQLIK